MRVRPSALKAASRWRPEMSRLSYVIKIGFNNPTSRMLSTSAVISPRGRIRFPTLMDATAML